MESTRKIFIGGNWKCNGDSSFINSHCQFLNSLQFEADKVEVVLSPTNIHLSLVASQTDLAKYSLCTQNVSMFDNGAYTGEVSAKQIKDLQINYTLIGHSERRQYFHEDEEVIAKKLKQALSNGLKVILCIGEKLSERESNQTLDVIFNQLKTLQLNVKEEEYSNVVIAYEPVWAIGTGKTASPQQAQEVHNEIRKYIQANISENVSKNIRIIYGGSVTDQNCNELIKENDIDGFLVGGASLKTSFKTIIESYKSLN